MSTTPIIGIAVLVFCVAALLYYQSNTMEHFGVMNTWTPKSSPIAGRWYNPNTETTYPVPPDLNRAPISKPGAYPPGAFPTANDNIPNANDNIPKITAGPRQTMAQKKDLYELDSKIMTWMEAASQRENEKPGSLTPVQHEQRIILQARLENIRQQLGLNNITDSYSTVINEISALRRENAGWQHQTPFASAAYEFGKGVNPNNLLTKDQYDDFFSILGDIILQFEMLYQPDPIQKVRHQQLQIIRQSLIDSSSLPPIRMGAASLFLRQSLRPEQPLPTLIAIDTSEIDTDFLENVQWEMKISYNPAQQEMKYATEELRGQSIQPPDLSYPASSNQTNDTRIINAAKQLCYQIQKAFPNDASVLGCRSINTEYDAETVINTVCDRLRTSVPSVTPEQFNCSALKQMMRTDG